MEKFIFYEIDLLINFNVGLLKEGAQATKIL